MNGGKIEVFCSHGKLSESDYHFVVESVNESARKVVLRRVEDGKLIEMDVSSAEFSWDEETRTLIAETPAGKIKLTEAKIQ